MKVRIEGLPDVPTINGVDYAVMSTALHKERLWARSGHNIPQVEDWMCVGTGQRPGFLALRRTTESGIDEREVLDAHAGYGAFNFGSYPEEIVQTAIGFLSQGFPATVRVLDHPYYAPALDALTQATGTEAGMLFLSGTDAVEAAYVAVMRWRSVAGHVASGAVDTACVVSAHGCHHGTTHFARSLSSHLPMRQDCGELMPHVRQVPFGDLTALKEMLECEKVSMVILEPIQGISGCIVPPDGYLQGAPRTAEE